MDRAALNIDVAPLAGARALVALSGGADSVALLLLLREAGQDVCAAHFEHGIRGEESAADMAFCRDLCARLAVPFCCERGNVPANRRPGEGLEAAARRLRYAFLWRALDESGAQLLTTAHHADDQAETVLMHILRGAGPRGAEGMRALEGRVWRPLLGARKRELEQYLRDCGQDWREDGSNAIADTPRNALRLDVLPRLEAIYPGAVAALGRHARAQALENDFMEPQARRWIDGHRRDLPNGCCYTLDGMPAEAVLRRALRAELGEGASFERIERLAALAHAPRGRLSLADGRLAEKTETGLFITDSGLYMPAPVPLIFGGETRIPDLAAFTARGSPPVPVRGDPLRQVLRRTALEGAVVRTRQDGDFIRPLGMRGHKLLSDYMIDKKVERPLRDCVPLLARGGEVLWAVGLGISDECAVGPGDESLEIRCHIANNFLRICLGGTKA